eukprot:1015854-Alexandrium_andersonii.AAC.1
MSASLVGSEMCIRDRTTPAMPVTTQRLTLTCVEERPRQCAFTHSAEAVSYTHLTLPTICSV